MRSLSDTTIDHLREIAAAPDLEGTRYELLELLGRGGMSTVWRARDLVLQRTVALKVIDVVQKDPQAAARMWREARVIAGLEHPGIVPLHDIGVLADGRIYYAMKLVRGRRLDEVVAASDSIVELARIFEKICDAVAFAHAHGVVHRDLKPQNVMVGEFGEVLVMDWGLAKVLAEPQRVAPGTDLPATVSTPVTGDTAAGTVMGTPGYMAPEQARGEVTSIDERTDVFALGAILYFLIAARPPEALAADGETAIESPRVHAATAPRSLEAICLKAMAPDPRQRYPSVVELRDDVVRFLDDRRVYAYREGLAAAAARLASKYRTPLLLILAYLSMRVLLIWLAR